MNLILDKESFLKDLKNLIAIDSTNGQDERTEKYPLGKGVFDAIEYVLSVGKRFGFVTKNIDGYCGYAEVGTGELLGIIGHVDTVTPGNGWNTPPFECTLKGGILYGRGVIDNKGPVLLALYAMKALCDSGCLKNKRVRLIIGGDEESGAWLCMKKYRESEELPTVAFTPDGDYPVIFAEKGMLKLRIFKENCEDLRGFSLNGGTLINVVPDKAEFTVNEVKTVVKGRNAHASEPEKGVNAIILAKDSLPDNTAKRLIELSDKNRLGIDLYDNESGELTLVPSIMNASEGLCEIFLDIRYPVTKNGDDIIKAVTKKMAANGFNTEILMHDKPLYVDPNGHLVKTLAQIYNKCTGENDKPIAIGGGTYAKAFDNCVAFGAAFPDEGYSAHCPNENWSIDSVMKNFEIMTSAIRSL